jgi:hypothetical protein
MARQFGEPYSPHVSLALTWTETFQLFDDEAETEPTNLTDLFVRAQLRAEKDPAIDTTQDPPVIPDPVLEITTAGYYDPPPEWPVIEGFTIASPPTNGTIDLLCDIVAIRAAVSPTNAKVRLYWEVVITDKTTSEPVLRGKPIFLPAVTIPVAP